MPKKKTGPKSQHMENLNRKAFLAMNRAGALESAYMNLSSALIETMKKVESKSVTAEEALLELMAHWQYIDGMLGGTFRNIDNAIKLKRVPIQFTTQERDE